MFLLGNLSASTSLRILAATELYLNADHYAKHPKINDALKHPDAVLNKETYKESIISSDATIYFHQHGEMKGAIQEEARLTCENGTWGTLVHIMAMATALHRNIWSAYPRRNKALRPLFNGLISPIQQSAKGNDIVLLCSVTELDSSQNLYQPNHFVPVIYY